MITYLRWFPKTFHLHGIHSPFIYSFEKKCLRGHTPKKISQQLRRYRNDLSTNKATIKITDLGAGSRVFKSENRSIAAIAKHAGASQKRAELLYRIVSYFEIDTILELGTSLGLATSGMAWDRKTMVTTLEGCPRTAEVAQNAFNFFDLTNITLKVGDFKNIVPTVTSRTYDLIYFDGSHSKDATLYYTQQLLPTVKNNTIWIFDDIYWSREMTEAWKEVQQYPEVTASIDGYWFGIIFFRQEQLKEEFQIRL